MFLSCRGLLPALALTTLSTGLLAGAGVAAAADAPLAGRAAAAPELKCPEGARCGTVSVALDRANPAGPALAVAYAVLPRTDRKRPSLGTIVPNPGGPGVSTIGQAELYGTLLAPLRDRREVLLVDPRGTGGSGAISCPGATPAAALVTAPSVLGEACVAALGAQAKHYGSAAIADDIDAVRASLGIDRVDLWGDSYGTYLMTVYAARHPRQVRSIVLDGAFPVAFDLWGRDVLAGTRRVLKLACQRSHAACSGDRVLKQTAALAARLREKPIRVTVKTAAGTSRVTAGESDLATLVHAGGDPSGYRHLPRAIDRALRGDDRLLGRLIAESRISDASATLVGADTFSLGAAAAIACHDYPRAFSLADPPAKRRADYAAALAAVPASDFAPFSPDAWLSTDIDAGPKCLDVPLDPTAGSPLAGVPTAAPVDVGAAAAEPEALPDLPVLVLSGDLDANTPIEQGRAAAAQFPRATLAVVANAGHTPALDPCGLRLGLRFIERRRVDPRTCRRTGTPPRITPVR